MRSTAALLLAWMLTAPAGAAGVKRNPVGRIYFIWAGHNGKWASRQIQEAVPLFAALTAHGYEVEIDSWTTVDKLEDYLTNPQLDASAVFLSALGDGNGNVFAWCEPGSFDCPPPYHMKITPFTPEDLEEGFSPKLKLLNVCAGGSSLKEAAWKENFNGRTDGTFVGAPNGIAPEHCNREVAEGFGTQLLQKGLITQDVLRTAQRFKNIQLKPARTGDSILFVWGGLEGTWTDPQVRKAFGSIGGLLEKGWRVVVDTWARMDDALEHFADPRAKSIYWSSHGDGEGNLWAWCNAENLLNPEADCTSPFKQKVLSPERLTRFGPSLEYLEICACYSGQKLEKWEERLPESVTIHTHDHGVDTKWCQQVAGGVFHQNLKRLWPKLF